MTTVENNDTMQDKACKLMKFSACIICFLCFIANSYMIFLDFANNTTIISTTVIPSPGDVLESPTLLLCNTSAFKQPDLYTSLDGYKNNTMGLNDFLIDVLFVKGTLTNFFNVKPVSIKESVKEIETMFHGTCFLIDKKLQVN